MIGSIVHHQYHSPGWVFFHQQLLQEVDELCAVLVFSLRPGDLIAHPVVSTKNVPFLLCSRLGGRNASLLSDLHPAGPQGRIEVQRGFVHKDELEIVSEDLSFYSSSSSSAFALASLSCKWPNRISDGDTGIPWLSAAHENALHSTRCRFPWPGADADGQLSTP